MRVMQHFLTPGMEHRQIADLRAEPAWVGGNRQQSFRNGPKQQAINKLWILECQRGEFMRQREDDMAVRYREQLLGLCGEPLVASRGVALRTKARAA